MSRESDDNLSSINSTYTDMYQETVKRFTRSSLSPEMDRYSPSRRSTKSASFSHKSDRSSPFDLYLEATGRRRSSDHGTVLTTDTEQFIIGQRVWVGGVRPGQIAYIGETHFAPGEWAGVVLDEPNGKNDGCVSGKRYFQCEPKRGIFSRLTRLTLMPLSNVTTPTTPTSKTTPDRSLTVSPTASVRSSYLRSPSKNGLTVGDRVIVSSGFGSRPGVLRYLGETRFAAGNWCGIELDEATGKNDGSVDGTRYFECKPKYGVFVPIAKVSLSPSSKKSRLSRAGSRESLTSVGTLNSIATTNTSRLRMSAQRKLSSIKPTGIAVPKSQFSMQDLLREKQNHIEQLMIERDLDREDAQNQALQYQKNISELKSKIKSLEDHLKKERSKAEDLQFSVDEITCCGEELNAQTSAYKRQIKELEQQLIGLTSSGTSLETPPSKEENDRQFNLKQELDNALKEEQRLVEFVEKLKDENKVLRKELQNKDEVLEEMSLSICTVENLQKEIALLKKENEKERAADNREHTLKLEEKNIEWLRNKEELLLTKNDYAQLERDHTNLGEECEILRNECKSHIQLLSDLKEQITKMETELKKHKNDATSTDQLVKALETSNAEGKNVIEQKIAEIDKLNIEVNNLQSIRSELEVNLARSDERLKSLCDTQESFKEQLNHITNADKEKQKTIEDLQQQLLLSQGEIVKRVQEVEKLEQSGKEILENKIKAETSLQMQMQEQIDINKAIGAELKIRVDEIKKLEKDLDLSKENANQVIEKKTLELENLGHEFNRIQAEFNELKQTSNTSAQETSVRMNQLQTNLKNTLENLKKTELKFENLIEEKHKNEITLNQKTNELETTIIELESKCKMFDKLRTEHDEILLKYNELQIREQETDKKCGQYELELGDMSRKFETLHTKAENLTSLNKTLNEDILVSRTSLSDIQAEIYKLNEEVAIKQKVISDLQISSHDERIKLESQIETLNQKILLSEQDSDEQKQILSKIKEELQQKTENAIILEEKIIKQELQLSDAQRMHENLLAKYETLESQNESLQKDLIALRTTSTDSNSEILKLSEIVAAKQKTYDQLLDKTNTERSSLESQLQASQQRIDNLCSQIETLTTELKTVQEESFSRYESLKQEKDENEKLKNEISEVNRKLETLNTKCATLEDQSESLQKDLNSTRSVSTDANAEILKLTEKLTNKQKEFDEFTEKSSTELLMRENQIQEMNQSIHNIEKMKETLEQEHKSLVDLNQIQCNEYENTISQIKTNAQAALEELSSKEKAERENIAATFELKLKHAVETKTYLESAVSSLQNQIKLLQDELHKTQTEFEVKEDEMSQKIAFCELEKEQLSSRLKHAVNEESVNMSNAGAERLRLNSIIVNLTQSLEEKEARLNKLINSSEELETAYTLTQANVITLEAQVQKLEGALTILNEEMAHKIRFAEEDKSKINELRDTIQALQTFNANISVTNSELSQALEALEKEKSETVNIFELFELESDQNMEQLASKINGMKQQLGETQGMLQQKVSALVETENVLKSISTELNGKESALEQIKSSALQQELKLRALEEVNEQLQNTISRKNAELEIRDELEQQLSDYGQIIDEMDCSLKDKSLKISQSTQRIEQLELEYKLSIENQMAIKIENTSLKRKLEAIDLEKTRDIVALQGRINELQKCNMPKQNGDTKSSVGLEIGGNEDTTAQINFLNSIIIDMQRKNDTLKAKIDALEALPTDFTCPKAFELISKRKPAPRLFCDICDEFDKHETEDCPLQASDEIDSLAASIATTSLNDPANKKERKIPEQRKYCETCEVFGHDAAECENEECF